MNFKKYLILLVVGLVLLNVAMAAVYILFLSEETTETTGKVSAQEIEKKGREESEQVEEEADQEEGLGDEYYSVHFGLSDAIDLCEQEARSRNSNLILLYVNSLSTRFNELENLYFVKLKTQVGTPLLYDEKEHTCHIDPKTQGVAYYKELVRRKAVRPHE